MKRKVLTACSVVFWLIVWQAAAMLVGKSLLLASPVEVVQRLISLIPRQEFLSGVLFTLSKIMLGFLSGMVTGILFAVLAGRSQFFERLFMPLIATVKAIPVASFTILALIWISSADLSILITFLIAVPVVYSNIYEGIRAFDPKLTVMADVFGIPPFRRFVGIYLSQIMPYFRSAVKLAVGLCWKSGIAAEVIGTPKGSIGRMLYDSKIYLETADLFAWTLVVIVLSLITEKLFLLLVDIAVKRIEKL
ncbi:MAG: ABC transporter permease subunit [Ruminiclostridium sp.]|nr:ABC transporter permease subunit [Ruminiclostridium sp.]